MRSKRGNKVKSFRKAGRRFLHLALALTGGGCAGLLVYLFLLDAQVDSLWAGLALAGVFGAASLGTFLYAGKVVLPRAGALSARALLLLIALAAAGGWGLQSLLPELPLPPLRRQVDITLLDQTHPRAAGQTVRVVSVESDLPSAHAQWLVQTGDWQAVEGGYRAENQPGARLSWRGAVRRSLTIYLEASPQGGMVQIGWGDGTAEPLDLYADSERILAISHEFAPAPWLRFALAFGVWLGFALIGFFGFAAVFPQPLWRWQVLESGWGQALLTAALLAGALLEVIHASNLLRSYPTRDSAVFVYAAQRVLEGGVPYRDVWDHKGPLIYYLNALGLRLGGGRWGVWAVEAVSALAALAGLYWLALRRWGVPAALGTLLAFLAGFRFLYDGGNLTEEYALLFQAAAFWLLAKTEDKPTDRTAFLLGILLAGGFLLRPNLIGTQLTAAGLFWLRAGSLRRRMTGWLAAGFLLPLAGFGVYFASKGALAELWDQMFLYNVLYSINAGMSFAERMLVPWQVLKKSWFSLWMGLAWLAGLAGLLRSRRKRTDILLLAAVADLALGLPLYNASARGFRHYFLNLLPAGALLAGHLLWTASGVWQGARRYVFSSPAMPYLQALVLLLWGGLSALVYLPETAARLASVRAQRDACPELSRSLPPQGRVLMWGIETPLYIVSGWQAPGRWIYQTPLMQPWYAAAAQGQELVEALERDRTPLLIDTSPTNSEFAPLSAAADERTPPTPAVQVIRAYVAGHYRLEGTSPCFSDAWLIYRRVE